MRFARSEVRVLNQLAQETAVFSALSAAARHLAESLLSSVATDAIAVYTSEIICEHSVIPSPSIRLGVSYLR